MVLCHGVARGCGFQASCSHSSPKRVRIVCTDLSAATEPADLPEAARQYVAVLSEQIGVPVRLDGVGPGREQTVSYATA